MADGTITFEAILDDKKAQARLNKLTADIDRLREKISGREAIKSPWVEQAEALRVKIAEARAEAEGYQQDWINGVPGADAQQSAALERAAALQKEYDALVEKINKVDNSLLPLYQNLEHMEAEAGNLSAQLAGASTEGEVGAERAGDAIEGAAEAAEELTENLDSAGAAGVRAGGEISESMKRAAVHTKRTGGYLKRILIRRAVHAALATAMQAVSTWFSVVTQSNEEMRSSFANLKGAFLTLVQPISTAVIPVLTVLAQVLTRVLTIMAALLSMMTGATLAQSIESAKAFDAQAKALKNTGKAAKSASKSLAGFDEINQLAGGGAGSAGLEAQFDLEDVDEGLLQKILDLVELIGSAFIAWRIGSALGLDLAHTLGLVLAVYGTLQFIKAIFDMWENGIDFGNLIKALEALTLTVGGLSFALGKKAAGIALVVGGLALLVTGIKDAIKNGLNWANTLTMIAGILSAGIGIGLMTGNWIPLLIGAIASVLVALAMLTGNGSELIEGLRNVFDGFVKFVKGVFSGDMSAAFEGLKQMGLGFKQAWSAIVQSVKDAWFMFVKWFDEKTNGIFHNDLVNITRFFSGTFEAVRLILQGVIQFIKGAFTGDWQTAWNGVRNILRGVINGIITMFETALNWIISKLNKFSLQVPNVPKIFGDAAGTRVGFNFQYVTIPRLPALAEGAVIPPNREFLAVLGDQSNGNNIEAPEGLIRSIVQGEMSTIAVLLQELIQVEREGKVIKVDKRELGRTARDAMRGLSIGGY